MREMDKLILHTLHSLERKMKYFGKTITQKAFYFLNEVYGAGMPFSFSFYHYGPYSFDLQHELDKLELYGMISVKADPYQTGYSYQLTDVAKRIIPAEQIENHWSEKIDDATDFVKDKKPQELELLSTIHFAHKVHDPQNVKALIEIVRYLKPKFTAEEIGKKISFLKKEEMIPESL